VSSAPSLMTFHAVRLALPRSRRSAPNQDQIDRARVLAEDLLVVLRIEYQKARDGTAGGGAPGVYQPGSGTYAPAQNGPDYASYYNVSANEGEGGGAARGRGWRFEEQELTGSNRRKGRHSRGRRRKVERRPRVPARARRLVLRREERRRRAGQCRSRVPRRGTSLRRTGLRMGMT
jgi:hypothetical protein